MSRDMNILKCTTASAKVDRAGMEETNYLIDEMCGKLNKLA